MLKLSYQLGVTELGHVYTVRVYAGEHISDEVVLPLGEALNMVALIRAAGVLEKR